MNDRELRMLRREVAEIERQMKQKFTGSRQKRQELQEYVSAIVPQFNEALDRIDERLNAIERELGIDSAPYQEPQAVNPTPEPEAEPEAEAAPVSFADTSDDVKFADGGLDE